MKSISATCHHQTLWARIAKEMPGRGFSVTTAQCDNKFKALKRVTTICRPQYVDHNNNTGSDRKTCKFYEEFDRLYGYKVSTRPVYTLGTVKRTKKDSTETQTSIVQAI